MQSQQFQDLLNAVPLLSRQQKHTLSNALSGTDSPSDIGLLAVYCGFRCDI